MELFHTSAEEIKSISADGRFGEFLFFSTKVYAMTAGKHVTYKIDLSEDDVIEASQLFFHEGAGKLDTLVASLAARLGVDAETAEALIEESSSVFDIDSIESEDAAEASWTVQHFTARAAKLLGFRAVRVQDEQGSAYMIDMLGREAELAAA